MEINWLKSEIHPHGLSQLGIENVNDLCLEIYNFAYNHNKEKDIDSDLLLPPSFWSEMMVQYSRQNKYLIKLTINPSNDREYETFKQSIAAQWIQSLISKTHSNIESVVYQKCPSKISKPHKYDTYYVLYGTGFISHSTAVFHLPLSLSCGTFCEPNLEMEQRQFEFIRKWFQDLTNNNQTKYTLIAKGREIIPYICEIHYQFSHLLRSIIAIAPCKRVYKDALYNLQRNVNENIEFECHYSDHRDHNDMTDFCMKNISDNKTEIICLITAGRNGLSLQFIEWIKSLSNVDRMVYSSCNQKVTFREMNLFLKGQNGFILDDYSVLQNASLNKL